MKPNKVMGKKTVSTSPNFGRKGEPTETSRDAKMATAVGHGGDRKTQDFHLNRASHHMVKALEKRLSAKDK